MGITLKGTQQRFYEPELRFDMETRRMSGTVMRYGETAVISKKRNIKERFEAGVFGTVERSDVIFNLLHQRTSPLTRTGGGGLTLRDSATDLRMETTLPKTRAADDAIELVGTKVLRGLSVEFKPDKYRIEDGDTIVHERAELTNFGLVDRPAYKGAEVSLRGEDDVTKEEIQKMVAAELEAHRAEKDPLTAESVAKIVTDQVTAAFKTRDDDAQKRAETDTAEKRAEAEAEHRGELLANMRVAGLLPKGFDAAGKTVKDILVASVGTEVTDASKRSEGYLERAIEEITARRSTAKGGTKRSAPKGIGNNVPLRRPLTPAQMRNTRKGA